MAVRMYCACAFYFEVVVVERSLCENEASVFVVAIAPAVVFVVVAVLFVVPVLACALASLFENCCYDCCCSLQLVSHPLSLLAHATVGRAAAPRCRWCAWFVHLFGDQQCSVEKIHLVLLIAAHLCQWWYSFVNVRISAHHPCHR